LHFAGDDYPYVNPICADGHYPGTNLKFFGYYRGWTC
jgi:hypothetical protein